MLLQALDRLVAGRRYWTYLAKYRDSAHDGILVTIAPEHAVLQAIL
jgi:hypothetical protein